MKKYFASTEYENQILDAVLGRVERDLRIKNAKATNIDQYRKLVENEMRECYTDPVYFIENYLYTDKNPFFFSDRIRTHVPYLLFDYQIETIDILLECVDKGERAFIEKSRQLGLSWLVCAFALWGFLFKDWKILFLSQKEDYVDKIGDMQSLFQKIRFMMAELPDWMIPPTFSIETHMPRLRIYKPKGFGTGSITGESANKNASTGGTYKFVFMDEMAKMENASSINTAIQATTGCIIYNSTPLGKFNEYYRMRCLAVEGKMRHIRLHWSMNPMYTKEWYLWKTKSMTPEQIAQELEIDYTASMEGRVYPRFAPKPTGDCEFGEFNYDPNLPLYYSIDNSHGGKDNHAIIVAQTTMNGKIRIIDSHQFDPFVSISECASLLAKQPLSGGKFTDKDMEFYERIREYKNGVYIADPYDTNATWDDTSISKIYRNYGIYLMTPDRKKGIAERIRVTTLNLGRIQINANPDNANSLNWDFVSCIQSAHYPNRNEMSQSTSVNYTPVHDASSHFRTSFEYLVNSIIEAEESLGIYGGIRQKEPEKVMTEVKNYVTGEITYEYR